VYLTSMK